MLFFWNQTKLNMKKIALGPLIKEKFDARRAYDRNFTVAYFAQQLNVHRATIYQLFRQQSIDVYMLIRISEVLHYDFVGEVCGRSLVDTDPEIFVGVKLPSEQVRSMDLPEGFMTFVQQ